LQEGEKCRGLSDEEAALYRDVLQKHERDAVLPYEGAILVALRELTGRDTAPTAAAWRKLMGLTSPK